MTDEKKHDIADDAALFRQEVADAAPLRASNRINPPKVATKIQRHQTAPPLTDPAPGFSDMVADTLVGNEEVLLFKRPGIQHRQFAKLRAGKIHIEAELDLHGLTSDRAEPMLAEFLMACLQQQIRCVRIIHGKGWSSRDNLPILKSKVNTWLRQHPSVLAFASATVNDGGSGALYILLKRHYAE
ncbi:hypothetical protein Q7C_140 [Methylophaga frappieri]|uniref:Smr domain-containing protein n=1 Tax=Methylophaga frappieri (strain ATCC BAA-2434 / DSM 25690 / JAM7) TaxID=754477 RepID=I1YEH8_METFJ|nr:Smr/MutS family protein [Methylophaga frappieri]AFJ01321.1 hypothetical protein Q7C_140 [Methylophaga frappieri]